MKLLNSEKDLQSSITGLQDLEPRFNKVVSLVGKPTLRPRERGFKSLLKIIVSQQLSVSAASSIWDRLSNAGIIEENKIMGKSDSFLRSMGLSKQKIKYARLLAQAKPNYCELSKLDDTNLLTELTKIKGIGSWSAQIYMMFSLRRSDIFPAGDLALQEASKNLFDMEIRPTEKEMTCISIRWSPFRTVSALILWDYYGFIKTNKGIIF